MQTSTTISLVIKSHLPSKLPCIGASSLRFRDVGASDEEYETSDRISVATTSLSILLSHDKVNSVRLLARLASPISLITSSSLNHESLVVWDFLAV